MANCALPRCGAIASATSPHSFSHLRFAFQCICSVGALCMSYTCVFPSISPALRPPFFQVTLESPTHSLVTTITPQYVPFPIHCVYGGFFSSLLLVYPFPHHLPIHLCWIYLILCPPSQMVHTSISYVSSSLPRSRDFLICFLRVRTFDISQHIEDIEYLTPHTEDPVSYLL